MIYAVTALAALNQTSTDAHGTNRKSPSFGAVEPQTLDQSITASSSSRTPVHDRGDIMVDVPAGEREKL
jgi:hypothetical protein